MERISAKKPLYVLATTVSAVRSKPTARQLSDRAIQAPVGFARGWVRIESSATRSVGGRSTIWVPSKLVLSGCARGGIRQSLRSRLNELPRRSVRNAALRMGLEDMARPGLGSLFHHEAVAALVDGRSHQLWTPHTPGAPALTGGRIVERPATRGRFTASSKRRNTPIPCFDAFSSREPVSTSLEDARVSHSSRRARMRSLPARRAPSLTLISPRARLEGRALAARARVHNGQQNANRCGPSGRDPGRRPPRQPS